MKRIFLGASSFYAPAYVAATKALRQPEDERGWKLMVSARVDKGKNKASPHDELEKEKRWVHDELHKYEDAQERVKLRQLKLEEEIASGAFFECGCCFTDTALSQIGASAVPVRLSKSSYLRLRTSRSHLHRRLRLLLRLRPPQRREPDRHAKASSVVSCDSATKTDERFDRRRSAPTVARSRATSAARSSPATSTSATPARTCLWVSRPR